VSNIILTQIPAQFTLKFISSSPQCNLILRLSCQINQRNHLNIFFSSYVSIESRSMFLNLSPVMEFLRNIFTNFIFEKLISHEVLVTGSVTSTSSMEILHSLLYRNWSVNFHRITPFHFGKARLFPLHVTVCGKPCDRLRQKPRQTR